MQRSRSASAAAMLFGSLLVLGPLTSAETADAREPSVWAQCDGQAKPEGAGVTAARMAGVILGSGILIGLLALPESPTSADIAVGQAGVDACTAALADPILETFWPRKVNVLRARALNYVQIEKYDLALADMVAAREVGQGKPAELLFDRSVGVSVLLFEAALRARVGEVEEARRLAARAADSRPYSTKVQNFSRVFFADTPTLTAEEARMLNRISRQAGTHNILLADRLSETIDSSAAADAWERLLASGAKVSVLRVSGLSDKGIDVFEGDDPIVVALTALAVARAGRVERAGVLRDRLVASLTLAPTESTPRSSRPEGRTRADLLDARVAQVRVETAARVRKDSATYLPLIDAILLNARGDAAGAVAIVQRDFSSLPVERATAELLAALGSNTSVGSQVPAFLVESMRSQADKSQVYKKLDLLSFARNLPQFQRVDGFNRYRPQGPPGFRNGIGFLSDSRDDGTPGAEIQYGGAPSLEAAEEMLLLRAAELATEQGHKGLVVDRRDSDGISVRFVAADVENFLPAEEIISALRPVYVDMPARIEMERSRQRRR
jgi:hypothetical protein